MEAEVYRAIAHVEDSHWWFVGTRRALLDRILPLVPKEGLVLDAGCGSGGMLRELARLGFGRVVGFDVSTWALEHAARTARGRLAAADLARLPFAEARFDLVTCADVLEHIEDDLQALSELRRVLRPGGHLGLVVPAFPCLWTDHDVANHHFRRYRLAPLCKIARAAGLSVDAVTHVNMVLGIPLAAHRLAGRLVGLLRPASSAAGGSDIWPLPGIVNRLCGWIYGMERRVLARHDLPFGTSILAVFTRPA